MSTPSTESSNTGAKVVFILILGVLLMVGGAFLSSYMVQKMIKLPQTTHSPTLWLDYWKAKSQPAYRPYEKKIKTGVAIGFGVPGALFAGLLLLALIPRQRTLHGNARFASSGELASKGMFKPHKNGIVVGKMGGKLLRLGGQQFVILAAPTRSGKGVGIVIPNLLDYQESMVVLDIKQENFDLTSGWRSSVGHEIYLLNPFAEDRRSHRWNPLSYVSDDPAFRVSDLMSIAAMLYPDGAEDQKFWVSQARNAFMAFSLFLFEK